MLKKTVTYTDYDGNERTEDFYFNLTKAELTGLFNSINGGLQAYLDQILKSKDAPKIMDAFTKILAASYGVKSLDGRRFSKSDEIFAEFKETEAYSQIFMELCTDSVAGAKFIEGVLPQDLVEESKKLEALNKQENNIVALPG